MKRSLIIAFVFSCTSPDRAMHTLESQGFTNIEIGGYGALQCGRDDRTCTTFDATTQTGARVHGAVGCGYGCAKGCTIRIH